MTTKKKFKFPKVPKWLAWITLIFALISIISYAFRFLYLDKSNSWAVVIKPILDFIFLFIIIYFVIFYIKGSINPKKKEKMFFPKWFALGTFIYSIITALLSFYGIIFYIPPTLKFVATAGLPDIMNVIFLILCLILFIIIFGIVYTIPYCIWFYIKSFKK
ncbi:MAG: hypothetical protein WC413_03595 [Candidatus Nanoarchaeia archaeon]